MDTEVMQSAKMLCRDLLVIRCCHNKDNMDIVRFCVVMQIASGSEEPDKPLWTKLALSHDQVVAIGSVDIAGGKHVKLVRHEMSSGRVQ